MSTCDHEFDGEVCEECGVHVSEAYNEWRERAERAETLVARLSKWMSDCTTPSQLKKSGYNQSFTGDELITQAAALLKGKP